MKPESCCHNETKDYFIKSERVKNENLKFTAIEDYIKQKEKDLSESLSRLSLSLSLSLSVFSNYFKTRFDFFKFCEKRIDRV